MHRRNLSPRNMFAEIAQDHVPLCQFNGKDKKYFSAWKKNTLPKVLSTIGDYPPCCARIRNFWANGSILGICAKTIVACKWRLDCINKWICQTCKASLRRVRYWWILVDIGA